jgi:hypothetical protein
MHTKYESPWTKIQIWNTKMRRSSKLRSDHFKSLKELLFILFINLVEEI